MAVIRLELEIDSEVYPELHAALAAVGSPASRGERFRQLAATGLVWETVRIHGASVTRIEAAPAAVPATAPLTPPSPDFDFSSGDRFGDNAHERTFVERRAPPPSSSDFIDLALNAAPPAEPVRAPAGVERRAAPRHVPMLMDVVTPAKAAAAATLPPPPPSGRSASVPAAVLEAAPVSRAAPAPAAAAAPAAAPAPAPIPLFETEPERLAVPVPAQMHESLKVPEQASSPAALDAIADAMADTIAEASNPQAALPGPAFAVDAAPALADADEAPKPPVRSRLMRMKEMGLFKNG